MEPNTHHPCSYCRPVFSSCDYCSVLFFGIGNLLAQMLFIVCETCNRRIITGYRRILSAMAADIKKNGFQRQSVHAAAGL